MVTFLHPVVYLSLHTVNTACKIWLLVLAGWFRGLECPRCSRRLRGTYRRHLIYASLSHWCFSFSLPSLLKKQWQNILGRGYIFFFPFWSWQKFPLWQNSNACPFAFEKEQVLPPSITLNFAIQTLPTCSCFPHSSDLLTPKSMPVAMALSCSPVYFYVFCSTALCC